MRVDCDDCGDIHDEKDLMHGPYDNMICHPCGIMFGIMDSAKMYKQNLIMESELHKRMKKLIDLRVDMCENVLTQKQVGVHE